VALILIAAGIAFVLTRGGGSARLQTLASTSSTTTTIVTSLPPSTPDTSTSTSTSTTTSSTTTPLDTTTLVGGLPPGTQAAYLDQLTPVQTEGSGTFSAGEAKANAVQYLHAVTGSPSCQSSGAFDEEFDLSRQWQTFSTTVALDDNSSSGSDAFYALYNDGVQTAKGKLVLGQSVPVKISVSGVLRLRLEVTDPNSAGNLCGFQNHSVSVVFGDPLLAL
jgi:hypothetical protein